MVTVKENKKAELVKNIEQLRKDIITLKTKISNKDKTINTLKSLTEKCMRKIMTMNEEEFLIQYSCILYMINNILFCYMNIERENWRIKNRTQLLELEKLEAKLRGEKDTSVYEKKKINELDIHKKTMSGIVKELNLQLDSLIDYCNSIGINIVKSVNLK